jgi:UDP-glucose 4-epimerase
MSKVLVTGGGGYIGSHTLVSLLERGYQVVSADDHSRSDPAMLEGVKKITGTEVKNYQVDLKDRAAAQRIFAENPDIEAVIHFAAYKTVAESVARPLLYFANNNGSLLSVLGAMEKHRVKQLVFSSSCTVYGRVEKLPVTEQTPLGQPECPYARTKLMGEQMISDFAASHPGAFVSLRYFNPAGAHPSGLIGENPLGRPDNLVPSITRFAAGRLPELTVFGDDYPTRDGSCIRDYIHVMDIARAHVDALAYMKDRMSDGGHQFFNLGSGAGTTVLELLKAFERVNGIKLDYKIGPRRPGDLPAIYADNQRAKELLGWEIKHGLDEMMASAWKWEQTVYSLQGTGDRGQWTVYSF